MVIFVLVDTYFVVAYMTGVQIEEVEYMAERLDG